jgi:chorismate dehydratase
LKKIKVGIVNYLNTKPLLYGLQHQPIREKIELIGQYPSQLAQSLLAGKIDLALLPVAAIPDLPSHHIVGRYGIASEGEVASVALFSEKPLQEIKKIYLDYQSRTSAALLKYLVRESWHITPELIQATDETYRDCIQGDVAGLVIGDRAFDQRKISAYRYDLGLEWKKYTGLPFVFALWVSIHPLPEDFIQLFDEANEWGVAHIDEVIRLNPNPQYDMNVYFRENVKYKIDAKKMSSVNIFLHYITIENSGI